MFIIGCKGLVTRILRGRTSDSTDEIELEDSGYLLTEDGDKILQE